MIYKRSLVVEPCKLDNRVMDTCEPAVEEAWKPEWVSDIHEPVVVGTCKPWLVVGETCKLGCVVGIREPVEEGTCRPGLVVEESCKPALVVGICEPVEGGTCKPGLVGICEPGVVGRPGWVTGIREQEVEVGTCKPVLVEGETCKPE